MKIFKIFSVLILFPFVSNGQIDMKVRFNNSQGINQLNSGDLQSAIASFTKSINLKPNGEAYYYRAKAYSQLNQLAEYCEDIEQAYRFSFKDAEQLLNRSCYKVDTFYVDNLNQHADSLTFEYMKILKKSLTKDKLYFTVKNRSSEVIFSYYSINQDTVFTRLPNNMPEFPGGENGLNTFLTENIKYPSMAIKYHISGTVYLTFIIDEFGEIKNVKVLKGVGGGCIEEAFRVINLMPKWKPGIYNGKAVPVQYNLPIRFNL